jgi:hypothetical protein
VTSFAYPCGAVNHAIRQVAAEYFTCACSDDLGVSTARSDPLVLERVEAYYVRFTPVLAFMFDAPFAWYLRARNLPRRMRRRLARATSSRTIPSRGDGGAPSVEEAVHER